MMCCPRVIVYLPIYNGQGLVLPHLLGGLVSGRGRSDTPSGSTDSGYGPVRCFSLCVEVRRPGRHGEAPTLCLLGTPTRGRGLNGRTVPSSSDPVGSCPISLTCDGRSLGPLASHDCVRGATSHVTLGVDPEMSRCLPDPECIRVLVQWVSGFGFSGARLISVGMFVPPPLFPPRSP